MLDAVKIEPSYVHFGRVPANESSRSTVSILRADGGPIKPRVGPIDKEGVGASVREIEPGQRYELVLTLTPPLKVGRLSTNLQVESGVSKAPTVKIPLIAVIAPPRPAEPTPGKPPAAGKQGDATVTPGASAPAGH